MKIKEIIKTGKAPGAIGPYSQAVKTDDLIFVSGQIPFTAENRELISDNIEEQTRQVLKNIKEILEAAGVSLSRVVKTTIFTRDLDQFDAVNEIYAEFFKEEYPARTFVEVSRLPRNAKIEIEAIAML